MATILRIKDGERNLVELELLNVRDDNSILLSVGSDNEERGWRAAALSRADAIELSERLQVLVEKIENREKQQCNGCNRI